MIRLVGDVSLTDGYFDAGFGLGSLVKAGINPLANIQKKGDFWIGNFEGVASNSSTLEGIASRQFRIEPSFIDEPLKLFDVLGIANNHVMQHGNEAYEETNQSLLKKGIKTFGSVRDRTTFFNVDGKDFSVTGFSLRIDQFSDNPLYWHNPELISLIDEVHNISQDVFKIVYVHWGYEYMNRPSQYQKLFAHLLIDMGYDMVVGMHPHVMQGFEIYKSKYIFYSLGNFSFDMPWERTKYGAVVNLTIGEDTIRVTYDYVHIDSELRTCFIDEESVPNQFRFTTLNNLLKIEDNGEQYFDQVDRFYRQYRRANHKDIIRKVLSHPRAAVFIIKDFIKRRIIK